MEEVDKDWESLMLQSKPKKRVSKYLRLDELIRARYAQEGALKIAKEVGISNKDVGTRAYQLGIRCRVLHTEYIGKCFGRLKVTGISTERSEDGRILLDCLCDCGNKVHVHPRSLSAGNVRSCGCLRTEWLKHYHDDIRDSRVGQRFSRLIVLDVTEQHNVHGNRLYKCKCDCGKKVLLSSSQLLTGNTKSCGCLERDLKSVYTEKGRERIKKLKEGRVRQGERDGVKEEEYKGKRYGKLVVLAFEGRDKYSHRIVSCQCDCGSVGVFLLYNLEGGRSQSCGCEKGSKGWSESEKKFRKETGERSGGISYCVEKKKWQAYLTAFITGDKKKHLGFFDTEIEAQELVLKAKGFIKKD